MKTAPTLNIATVRMDVMPHGYHENVPDDLYHSHYAVSNSELKLIADFPGRYLAKKKGLLNETSDALAFGRRFHVAVLEPERFAAGFICKPQSMSFATKEGKAWRDLQTKEVVPYDDYQMMLDMAASAHAHPAAGPYLREKGRYELSAFAKHERTGVELRCRFDKLTASKVIVDLKSTLSARPFSFLKDAAYRRYHQQSAFYQDMPERFNDTCEGMIFIAIEKKAPYPVLCFEFNTRSILKGRSEYERLLDVYKKCVEENRWPGYSEETELLDVPDWALSEKPFEPATSDVLETA